VSSRAAAAAEGGGPQGPPLLTAEAAGQEGAVHVERRVVHCGHFLIWQVAPFDGRTAGTAGLSTFLIRQVHGPAVFMPEADEWIHQFSWHGSIRPNSTKGSKTGYAGDEKVKDVSSEMCRRSVGDLSEICRRSVGDLSARAQL
jgi:hypothetical protein